MTVRWPASLRGCPRTVFVLQVAPYALQVTVSWPAASPVEYAWLKDAATGEVSSNNQWSVVHSKS